MTGTRARAAQQRTGRHPRLGEQRGDRLAGTAVGCGTERGEQVVAVDDQPTVEQVDTEPGHPGGQQVGMRGRGALAEAVEQGPDLGGVGDDQREPRIEADLQVAVARGGTTRTPGRSSGRAG